MSKSDKHDPKWVEAKRRCQLNQDDIAKAKALGMTPKSLLKNIPNQNQKWKQPVKYWIRELYEKKFGVAKTKNKTTPTADPADDTTDVPF